MGEHPAAADQQIEGHEVDDTAPYLSLVEHIGEGSFGLDTLQTDRELPVLLKSES